MLHVESPTAQVQSVRQGRQTWGHRMVVDLDRSTPWRMTELTVSRDAVKPRQFSLTLDATASPAAIQRWKGAASSALKNFEVKTQAGQTTITGEIAGNMRPQVSMVPNPNRLVIDVLANAPQPRSILWAPGLQWQEQSVTVSSGQFPVVWLTITPQQPGLKMKPIWGNSNALVGINPLLDIAGRSRVAAAINGGYFNRNNQTTLGAVRRDGQWISSPVLNRGAVAWNDSRSACHEPFNPTRNANDTQRTTPRGVPRQRLSPARHCSLLTGLGGPAIHRF